MTGAQPGVGHVPPPKYVCNYGPLQVKGKWPQTRAPTDKGPLYRQGASTPKELIHKRGPYRQNTPIDADCNSCTQMALYR